ncbi:DUF1501 domain-containing protein [Ideonella sp.]|uniref:DUF1501 domain-containing protein n=1 Tax=Ideonella sp. TaxID=1929293 RepID=UPI003BB627B3
MNRFPQTDRLSQPTRRALLRQLGALGVAGPAMGGLGLSLAAIGQASAASSGGYRALVCIYLAGGNDAYNTVLATDSASWAPYAAARSASTGGLTLAAPGTAKVSNSSSLHARLGGVLPIDPLRDQGRSYALHPVMGEVATLFQRGRIAIVPNVGPLSAPTSKAAFIAGTAARPPKLFSHNDQQSIWQSFAAEGATRGWGGRMADLLMSGNQQAMFTATSVGGNAVWLAGDQTLPYQLSTAGAIRIGGSASSVFGAPALQQKMLNVMSRARNNHLIERELASVAQRSGAAEALLRGALPSSGPWATSGLAAGAADPLLNFIDPVTGAATPNVLAQQLQSVARMIAARQSLGMTRQVFFVSLPGFDTHDDQADRQAQGLARLAQGLAYFDRTLTAMGMDDAVTTFTASDFGRNLSSNGNGCDHGWGGHHFVMGGDVRGGDLYGNFPVYGAAAANGEFNSPNQLTQGGLLPEIPVEGYAATLGRWMGLSDAQLLSLMPNLSRFNSSTMNLGFMA